MTALALFALAFTACLAGAAAGHWWVIRPLKQSARDSQRIEDIETRAAIPAAPDNREGVNRGDWDDCELILAATTEVEAGWQRLINDLRKEEK